MEAVSSILQHATCILSVSALYPNPRATPSAAEQLGFDELSEFDLAFAAALSDDRSDLLLTYTVTNASGASKDVSFLSFVDAEIDNESFELAE